MVRRDGFAVPVCTFQLDAMTIDAWPDQTNGATIRS
jgi:hypothetical protein